MISFAIKNRDNNFRMLTFNHGSIAHMLDNDINSKKAQAVKAISEILLSMSTPGMGGVEKTSHIFDVLEELLAKMIAGSSVNQENISELCDESLVNIKNLAKRYLYEEGLNK